MKIINHLKTDWFRYGFETIAVVVGILVAFALDNWNEGRKQEILEIQYLNGLKADLGKDTIYYNRRISDSEEVIIDNTKHIHQMYQLQISIEEVKSILNLTTWNSELLTTQNSTYIDLTNSGSLNIIRNQLLKESVIDYYRENEMAAVHISEFNEVSSRHLVEVGNVIRNYAKFFYFNEDLYEDDNMFFDEGWEFINEPTSDKFQTLEYAVSTYRLKHNAFLDHFETLKELSVQLIEEIQKELDSRL